MPCFTPLKGYRGPGGRIVFSPREGFYDRPLEVPCGQCVGCRFARSQQWALRCVHEAQMHLTSCFITLTYDQDHVPLDGSLHVEHWQNFAKKMRRDRGPFRFYMCGEYGEENQRPHWHALVFGQNFLDRIERRSRYGKIDFTSPTLEALWKKGNVSVGDLTFESAAYVARYCTKKLGGDKAEAAYTRFDPDTGECWQVRPPFSTMSRRPGIGSTWFDKFMSDVYPEDEVVHKGRRYKPPRYYDNKLDEQELERIKERRREAAAEHADELTYERLRVRERVAVARLGHLQRKLND